jgi:hypothetical protein
MDRQINEQNNQQNQQNNPQNDQSGQNTTNQQGSQFQFHFFIYPMPGIQGGDNATTPGVFFFTPFFMPQQAHKPHASESAMKKLPIVIITKEHLNSHASCPICLEPFSLSEDNEVNDKTTTTETKQQEPVRQMPCNHMYCESCLFQWLRQNNTCPLCRKEIEAEVTEAQQQEANVTNIPLFGMVNIPNLTPTTNSNSSPSPPNPSSNSRSSENVNSNVDSNANSNSPTRRPTISCALANVGCCEEIDNDVRTPIITLPQCHHRFHASCLRTSLLVEGYPPDDFNLISRPLNFHCPTCRAPAIVQSDMLKMSAVPHEELQREQQGIPFNLPLTVHIPDSDDMDLD